jgi:hypothetical protein
MAFQWGPREGSPRSLDRTEAGAGIGAMKCCGS